MQQCLKKIFIVAGKSRHGKDTTCLFIKEICEKNNLKVVNLAFGNYIKDYVKNITDWDGSSNTKSKYRKCIQTIGTEVVRDNIDNDFFVKRLCDDIKVYSYFFDVITVSDARYENELEFPKSIFSNVVTIHIKRVNFETDLTELEQNHRTEIGLDNYQNYDYELLNDDTLETLKEKIKKVVEGELK